MSTFAFSTCIQLKINESASTTNHPSSIKLPRSSKSQKSVFPNSSNYSYVLNVE